MGRLPGRPPGKLIAWVRWLHGADGPGPDYCDACVKTRRASTPCDDCPRPGLLPGNERAVELYLMLLTQWRHKPMGGLQGLDFAAAAALVRETAPRKRRRRLLEQLKIMEVATLDALAKPDDHDD